MTLFRLDASIRPEGSVSREIADVVEREWRDAHGDDTVVRRDIGLNPLAATTWPLAVSASRTPESERSLAQRDAARIAGELADELLNAESLLFAVPLYNFGVSQHFKTWVDVVLTDSRLASSATPALADKPAVLVVARGGAYGPATPRDGWDHATGWIRRILHDVWALDLKVVETEFTLVGVNPALDEFKEVAQQMRADSILLAKEHGRHLARVAVA
ncbi:MAG: FMN-dependent NADH-azoreductase [Acidimicrobiales bacterium]